MLVISILMFVVTLSVIPILVVRMPADYFAEHHPPRGTWRDRHPVIRISLFILKNLCGILLVALGLILSLPFVPGQGLLTILIGVSLLNFPGKRALELRLARARPVRSAINWLRARARRPPLEIPDPAPPRDAERRDG